MPTPMNNNQMPPQEPPKKVGWFDRVKNSVKSGLDKMKTGNAFMFFDGLADMARGVLFESWAGKVGTYMGNWLLKPVIVGPAAIVTSMYEGAKKGFKDAPPSEAGPIGTILAVVGRAVYSGLKSALYTAASLIPPLSGMLTHLGSIKGGEQKGNDLAATALLGDEDVANKYLSQYEQLQSPKKENQQPIANAETLANHQNPQKQHRPSTNNIIKNLDISDISLTFSPEVKQAELQVVDTTLINHLKAICNHDFNNPNLEAFLQGGDLQKVKSVLEEIRGMIENEKAGYHTRYWTINNAIDKFKEKYHLNKLDNSELKDIFEVCYKEKDSKYADKMAIALRSLESNMQKHREIPSADASQHNKRSIRL